MMKLFFIGESFLYWGPFYKSYLTIIDAWTSWVWDKLMHKAWSSKEGVPYVKFKGPTGQKIADFDPNCALRIVSLKTPMSVK